MLVKSIQAKQEAVSRKGNVRAGQAGAADRVSDAVQSAVRDISGQRERGARRPGSLGSGRALPAGIRAGPQGHPQERQLESLEDHFLMFFT